MIYLFKILISAISTLSAQDTGPYAIVANDYGNSEGGIRFLESVYNQYPWLVIIGLLIFIVAGVWFLMKLPELIREKRS